MKILSVNAGSSSLKFKAYEMPKEEVLASGNFERVGIEGSFYTIKINGEKIKKECPIKSHKEAFEKLMEELKELKVIDSFDEIKGVGHRIVQGADHYDKSVVATKEVVKDIEDLAPLAPLHNGAAVSGIKAAEKVIPDATHVVVFDTAFHQTMPDYNYLYALPMDWYRENHVRRYGAHGTSHKYITEKMHDLLGSDKKLIICHIGSGASITAVKDGKCVNTSMGFTPNAGLIMGTRCGDIDASIIPYIMEQRNLKPNDINNLINKESGVLAITEQYSDMRDVRTGVEDEDEKCELAMKMYVKRIVSYIARYYFELEGTDAIVFTAGVGENGAEEREAVLESLAFLGVKINKEKNNSIAGFKDIQEGRITTDDSTIAAYVIPTDEEVMIARDTYNYCL